MQNAVADLHGLFLFLRVPYGDSLAKFKALVQESDSGLRWVLNLLMLRRLKRDTYGGRAILSLPEKHVEIVREPLGPEEHRIYSALEQRARLQMNSFLEGGTGPHTIP